ncbi:MAG: nucleoside-diphosphate kinase [Gemmatimonadota bacterium]|jgi:nucleoside-diphosphate kinase|nr:nucleoside-diphosphate kinase [Gemmatimonadota bacterium]MDP6529314.1 nucleoside-diphosphate kinase [Gemmatimonadota bacterium]MDP6802199.1 nucleoside-diphosphate kinase [Gemmatimonadota bacterium]MDP7031529.1 nucleoside-diphosphate kinase [Gemmatimonadota bacterium]
MSLVRTLCIIKPDAVAAGNAGKILSMLEGEGGFRIVALRMEHLTEESARAFYAVHEERPFYADLVEFMTSGSCIPMVLERENAIFALRGFIGATNPTEAEEGSVRQLYGASIQNNAVHASDSPESAETEIPHFFADTAVHAG